MLLELHIENLAVIPYANLVFGPGLNVITGETGAGKTILAHAITLLLGARADSGLIRPGAPEATVEAVFSAPPGYFADLSETMDLSEDEDIAVRRRLSRDGRSRAYLGGCVVTLSVLGQITERLLKFSAQHEQRQLMMAAHQLETLDSFGGRELLDLRDEYRLLYERRACIIEDLSSITRDSETRKREAELLEFQVDEIEGAALVPGEDGELEIERRKLLKAGELKETAQSTATSLGAYDGGGDNLMDVLAGAGSRIEALSGVDDTLDELGGRLKGSIYELEEIGRAARDYAEATGTDPARLAEVEGRLDLIGDLKRKYGPGIEEVLDFAEQASRRLARFTNSDKERSSLEIELEEVSSEAGRLAVKMSRHRREAARELEKTANGHLGELAFRNCGFEVRVMPEEIDNGGGINPDLLSANGIDSVEFYVSLNPGMPATPIRETASGGELSRIMLAIKSAVSDRHEVATLVFDEIDAGIGGATGAAVGAKLKGLAKSSQVICITHLPQIACYADAHFTVVKDTAADGKDTVTSVGLLGEEGIVDDLCRMMGSSPGDVDARAHAGSLLKKNRAV